MIPDMFELDPAAPEAEFAASPDAPAAEPPPSPPRRKPRSLFQIVCLQSAAPPGAKTPS